MRVGGLILASGASFLYVKKVLAERRRQSHEEENQLQEQRSRGQYGVCLDACMALVF